MQLARPQNSFRDAELQPCEQVGNLGMVIDGALSWEAHVSKFSRRCMGVLMGPSHVRHCLPDGVLKTIVSALRVSRGSSTVSLLTETANNKKMTG